MKMGLYTESIKKKIKKDAEAVRKADAMLLHEFVPDSDSRDNLSDLRDIIDHVLAAYGRTSAYNDAVNDPDELMEYVLEPVGILYEKIDMTDPSWKDNTDFIIAFLEDGSPILITQSLFGHRYECPSRHYKGRLTKKTGLSKTGYAVYRPLDDTEFNFRTYIRHILKIVPARFWVVICVLAGLAAALNLVAPSISRRVLKEYVPMGRQATSYILLAILIFAVAGILRCILNAVKKYTVEFYKLSIVKQSQISVIARVLSLPSGFFRRYQSGHIATYVKNSRMLAEIVVEMIFCSAVTFAFSLICIPQMIIMSGPLAVAGLSILTAMMVFIGVSTKVFAKYLRLEMDAESELRGNMFTSFKGIQKIKTAGAENRLYAKWAAIFRKYLQYAFDPPLIAKLNGLIVPTLSTAVFYTVAWYRQIPAADFIAFSASFAILYSAVMDASDMFRDYYTAAQYVNHIRILFSEAPGIQQDQIILKNIKGEVKLDNVNFAYNPTDSFKMEDLNLTVAPGEIIGITGRSGCGKSTLLNMIVGMNKPVSGTVYIDNHPIETLNMRFVNRRIGFVTQYSSLLPGSIRYNVTMGNDEISDDAVWEALRKAQIADVVAELPDGLDSVVSETASGGFSGGQKQCLLLARAFVRNPSLLILDEATSALDNNTQAEVLKEIYQTKATVIMVAHRLSTIKKCDRIIVIEDGTIRETGTYDELMNQHGLFEQLVLSDENKDK